MASAAALALALLVIAATGRLLVDGRRSFAAAKRSLVAGDRVAAAADLEDAIRAYVPGSPYPGLAIRELGILAKAEEMRGAPEEGAALWERMRQSILCTRHVTQPNESALELAEREIARLGAAESDASPAPHPSRVARPSDPSALASVLLFAGLLVWIGGAAFLCLTPPERAGSGLRRSALVACVIGSLLWMAMAALAG